MQLHVPTMLVTTIVSAVLVGVVLPLARRRGDAPGIREATVSALCFAGACVLILLRDHVPDAVRIVPSNALMWFGFAFQWWAYARFDDSRASPRVPLGATALAVVGFAVVYAMGADYRERSLYASAAVGALAAASGWQLLREGGLRRERARGIGVVLAVVTIACQLVRVPLLLAMPSGDGALLSGTLEQSVAFVPAMVHVLGVGLGFLVMHVEHAARTDPLTGCANRRAFAAHVAGALARTAAGAGPVAVILTDLDRFKVVNDTHGHAVGDLVIRHFADALRAGVRPSDVVARLGGEEFCVLLPGADGAVAADVGARLCAGLRAREVDADGVRVRVTASFGVAVAVPGERWDALFVRADRALYAAKAAGRDRVEVA
jgi:diguanylate cyclase (GGDEF)-like protein